MGILKIPYNEPCSIRPAYGRCLVIGGSVAGCKDAL